MIGLITDFRKTALIAGIAIAASALWSFFRQLLIGPHGSTSHFVLILLLELPLPVFLVLLYRAGTTPVLSRNLKLVAAALAAIRGAAVLFAVRDVLRAVILPIASHAALPAWNPSLLISDAAGVVSGLAFLFFLVALARQRGPSRIAGKRASRQVRNAALIAIFARALLIIILLISFQVYTHEVRTYGQAGMAAPSVLSELRSMLFALPGLIAPWIILAGVKVSRQC